MLDRHEAKRPPGDAQADIIRLLLLTGCRKSEILKLRWREVDGDTLQLEDGKTRPETGAAEPRGAWPSSSGNAAVGKPLGVSLTEESGARARFDLGLWRKARKLAGIEDVRLHDLRHTFASQAAMRGIPLPVVARLLGHAQVQMTLRYAHVSDRDVEAAAERIGGAMAGIMKRIVRSAGARAMRAGTA